jgi:hypothetical protein
MIFIESRNKGDVDKKRSLDSISQRNSLSPAQGKFAQVKIMLMPSSLDKDEKRRKEESSCQSQAYSYVFYFSLEYRSLYYKRGIQYGDLNKTKVLKTQRDSKSDERKPNSKSMLKFILPIRPVGPVPEQARSTGLVQSLYQIPEAFSRLVLSWIRHVRRII